mmetsp:Transcript_4949/g.7556  ORF Transcript_4949/g.7556 Transcript_4949/m.7556 type:complete len:200 (-) Transcript_4949:349-948(-)
MGATDSQLGVSAMADVSDINRDIVLSLRWNIRDVLEEAGINTRLISKELFDKVLLRMDMLSHYDIEILCALFDMHDVNGVRQIDYQDLLVGLCILVPGSVMDKLLLAFEIFDEAVTAKAGYVKSGEMKKVLTAINNTILYFGDRALNSVQLKEIVIDIYKNASSPAAPLSYKEHIKDILAHKRFKLLLEGKGNLQFGVG